MASEENIAAGVFELRADGNQFRAEIANTTEVAKRFERTILESFNKAGAAASATGALEGSSKRYVSAIEREAAAIERKTASLVMSATEIRRAEAAARGETAGAADAITKLDAAERAYKRVSAAAQQAADVNAFGDLLTKSQSLGQVEKNIDKLTAALERLQGEARNVGTVRLTAARTEETQKVKAADDSAFVEGLRKRSDAIGKTQADLLELQAAERGLSVQAAPYIANLRAQEKALGIYTGGARDARVSTNQLRVAMQQLPAQFTDVFTSLAGGQNPLLVLIQQGGQIKDSFGGIGNALKGIGSAIASAFTPVRLIVGSAIAALGAIGYAFIAGEKEASAYRQALVLTGNAAGTTAGHLKATAEAVSRAVGTQGKAAETIAQLAATGRVAGRDLRLLAEAAIRLEREGGPAVKDAVAAFAELGKAPTQGALKLNETTRFLTVSVLEQIKALEEQGRVVEAARVAQNAYATEGIARAKELESQLGSLQRATRGVTSFFKEMWDAVLDVGRDQSPTKKLETITASLEANARRTDRANSFGPSGVREGGDAQRARLLEELKAANRSMLNDAERTGRSSANIVDDAYVKATSAVKKWGDESLTATQKAEKALKEFRRDVDTVNVKRQADGLPPLDSEYIKRAEKAINDSFASGNKTIKERDSGLESARAAAKKWADEIVGFQKIQMDSVAATEHMTSAERALAEILRDPAWEARSQSQKQLTIDSFLAAQAAIERAKAEKDATKAIEDAAKAEDKRRVSTAAMQKVVADYVKSIDDTVEFIRLEQSLSNESQRARQVAIEQFQVELELRRKIADINATDVAGTPDQAADIRARAIADAQAAAAIAKANISSRATYDPTERDAASAAVKDYLDEIERAGKATQEVTRQSLNLLEDDIVQSLARGKFDVKRTVDYMITEFLRLQVVRPLMKDLFGSGGSGGFGSPLQFFKFGSTATNGASFVDAGNPLPQALGGAFSPSGPIPLANGDVFGSPTEFSSGNKRYVMAEAGPEAVMPLKRGSDGKLGVAASGSAPTIVNNMTVNGDVSPQTVALMNSTLAKNNAALIRGLKTGTIGVN